MKTILFIQNMQMRQQVVVNIYHKNMNVLQFQQRRFKSSSYKHLKLISKAFELTCIKTGNISQISYIIEQIK